MIKPHRLGRLDELPGGSESTVCCSATGLGQCKASKLRREPRSQLRWPQCVSALAVAATKPKPGPHVRAALMGLHGTFSDAAENVVMPSHATHDVSEVCMKNANADA